MRSSSSFTIARWLGLLGCVAMVFAIAASSGKQIYWTNETDHHGARVAHGAIRIWWLRGNSSSTNSNHPGLTGWTISNHVCGIRDLWFKCETYLDFRRLTIPQWAPLATLAIPTFFLWYLHRKAMWNWVRWKMRPQETVRFNLSLLALFAVIHYAVVTCVFELSLTLLDMLLPAFFGSMSIPAMYMRSVYSAMHWSAPLWAVLWTFQCVRCRNRLLEYEFFPACAQCNYNLRGNESGICPECGTLARSHRNMAKVPISRL